MPGIGASSLRNGVPESSSVRSARANALLKPAPQASSSPRWWTSSATTSVRAVHSFA